MLDNTECCYYKTYLIMFRTAFSKWQNGFKESNSKVYYILVLHHGRHTKIQ